MHHTLNVVGLKRLGHDNVNPQFLIDRLIRFHWAGCNRHYGYKAAPLAQLPNLPDNFKTIHIGQVDIKKYEIHCMAANVVHCLLTGSSLYHFYPFVPPKVASQNHAVHSHIIYQQNQSFPCFNWYSPLHLLTLCYCREKLTGRNLHRQFYAKGAAFPHLAADANLTT